MQDWLFDYDLHGLADRLRQSGPRIRRSRLARVCDCPSTAETVGRGLRPSTDSHTVDCWITECWPPTCYILIIILKPLFSWLHITLLTCVIIVFNQSVMELCFWFLDLWVLSWSWNSTSWCWTSDRLDNKSVDNTVFAVTAPAMGAKGLKPLQFLLQLL